MSDNKMEGLSGKEVDIVAEHTEDVSEDVEFGHDASAFFLVLVGEDEQQAILR